MKISNKTIALLGILTMAYQVWSAGPEGLKGQVLFTDINTTKLYHSSLPDWNPKAISVGALTNFRCAKYSHDGKLVGYFTENNEVWVSGSDFKNPVMVAKANPSRAQGALCTWVKGGKWKYELAYPSGRATLSSTEIRVQASGLVIGDIRQIGDNLTGRLGGLKGGINGQFAVMGYRNKDELHLVTRSSMKGLFSTIPNNQTVVKFRDQYMWKEPNYDKLPAESQSDLNLCQLTMSGEGDWMLYEQVPENEPSGYYKDTKNCVHCVGVFQPWLRPGDPMPATSDNYLYVATPNLNGHDLPIDSYQWSNHPRFILGGSDPEISDKINKWDVWILELQQYPPVRTNGKYTTVKWHRLPAQEILGLKGKPWGISLWIESGVEPMKWKDGSDWSGADFWDADAVVSLASKRNQFSQLQRSGTQLMKNNEMPSFISWLREDQFGLKQSYSASGKQVQ